MERAERVKRAPFYQARRDAARAWRRERMAEKERGEEPAARLRRLPRHKRFEAAKHTIMGLALIKAGLI